MTRARNGAAPVATAGIHWHVIPDDDDRGPSKTFPPCHDGDELLARVGDEVVEVIVDRRHGVAFRREDGEAVEPDAIAERPRPTRHGATQTEESRAAAGMTQLKVRITKEQRRRLQWIHEQDGHDLSTIIGVYIDTEYEERKNERRKSRG